jgi:hypothetical protein
MDKGDCLGETGEELAALLGNLLVNTVQECTQAN